MKNILVTGGAGFIGSHLLLRLIEERIYSKIYVFDVSSPKVSHKKIKYIYCDITKPIQDLIDSRIDTIIHLAALCKEPGYNWEEYFETNYIGTKNICQYATRNDIANIIFTSTMMVYKAGEKKYCEEDLTAPDTGYGISKLLAEEVLLNWKNNNQHNRLRIVRLGVVFGKGENGNFTRLAKALKKNFFVYVGRKNTIKGSVYVEEVINFLFFLLQDSKDRIIYNFVFPEPDTIENICKNICETMGWKRFIPILPFRFLLLVSYIFELLNELGFKNPIHHRRIEKLYYSTYLSVDAALSAGYIFSYNLKTALMDWKSKCVKKDLS